MKDGAQVIGCGLFQNVTFCPETDELFVEHRDLRLLGALLAVARKGARRRLCHIPHPAPKQALAYLKVPAGLRNRHPALRHQPYRLNSKSRLNLRLIGIL